MRDLLSMRRLQARRAARFGVVIDHRKNTPRESPRKAERGGSRAII
jgi:hypothetical protein